MVFDIEYLLGILFVVDELIFDGVECVGWKGDFVVFVCF